MRFSGIELSSVIFFTVGRPFVKVDAAAARGSLEEYWTETYRSSTEDLPEGNGNLTNFAVSNGEVTDRTEMQRIRTEQNGRRTDR